MRIYLYCYIDITTVFSSQYQTPLQPLYVIGRLICTDQPIQFTPLIYLCSWLKYSCLTCRWVKLINMNVA